LLTECFTRFWFGIRTKCCFYYHQDLRYFFHRHWAVTFPVHIKLVSHPSRFYYTFSLIISQLYPNFSFAGPMQEEQGYLYKIWRYLLYTPSWPYLDNSVIFNHQWTQPSFHFFFVGWSTIKFVFMRLTFWCAISWKVNRPGWTELANNRKMHYIQNGRLAMQRF
jgi:hypothetical protein